MNSERGSVFSEVGSLDISGLLFSFCSAAFSLFGRALCSLYCAAQVVMVHIVVSVVGDSSKFRIPWFWVSYFHSVSSSWVNSYSVSSCLISHTKANSEIRCAVSVSTFCSRSLWVFICFSFVFNDAPKIQPFFHSPKKRQIIRLIAKKHRQNTKKVRRNPKKHRLKET